MLEQGPVEQKIIEQCMRANMPLPARIQNAPDLALGLELYYNAFDHLNRERPVGMGLSFIPFSSIIQYAHWLDMSQDETQDLVYLIHKLDEEYVKWRQKDVKPN